MNPAPGRRRTVYLSLAIFVIALVLRVPNFGNLAIVDDEDVYADFAFGIIAENWQWPVEFMISAPPAYAYLLAFTTSLSDGSMATLRIWSVLFGALTAVALYFLAKDLFGEKVGILSAVLIAFSSYHILYSRLIHLEAVIILLGMLTLLFFWRAYKEDSVAYAILCGLTLGIGLDVKYIAFALYPVLVISAILIGGKGMKFSIWAPLEKKFLVVCAVSLLVFMPVLITLADNGANPFYWQLFARYELQYAGYRPLSEFTLPTLFEHGLVDYITVLVDGESIAFTKLPWGGLLELVTLILVPLVVGYSLIGALKGDPGIRLSLCYFLVINGFVAMYATRFQYYLLWSVPIFYALLSKMTIDFIEHRIPKNVPGRIYPSLGRSSAIILILIYTFSIIATGSAASLINESVKGGYSSAFERITRDVELGDLVAGDRIRLCRFYLSQEPFLEIGGENLLVPLFKVIKKRQRRFIEVNTELLEITKPEYVVTDSFLFFSYSKSQDISYLKVNYRLIQEEQGILLYQRR